MVLVSMGLLVCLVPGLYIMVRISLAESVVMAEGRSGAAALSRSFDLTRGHFWLICLLILIMIAVLTVGALITTAPMMLSPTWDNWIFDAISTLVLDLIEAYFTLCLLCAFAWLRGPKPAAIAKEL